MTKSTRHVTKLFDHRVVIALALFLASAQPAQAYIGPGAGLGAILTTVAFLVGVLLLLVGFIWFPLKRMVRRMKGERRPPESDSPE